MATTIQTADLFDLRRFRFAEMPDSKDYDRVSAAGDHLQANCNTLNVRDIGMVANPIKIRCVRLEPQSVNSHGELELWIRDANERLSYTVNSPIRSLLSVPEEAVLCIDTQNRIDHAPLSGHPYLFLNDFWVYGNVREAKDKERHIPGRQKYFIELGALSYSDVGNSWTSGVYGKFFNGLARAEK